MDWKKKQSPIYHFRESEFVVKETWVNSWYPDLVIRLYYDTRTDKTEIIGMRDWKMR